MRLVFALLILLASAPAAAAEPTVVPAKLTTIQPQGAPISRDFYGRVAARSTVDLAFQAGGKIALLPAVEGAVIRQGEMLAQLDLDPFERDLARAQANLDEAQRNLARREALGSDTTPQAQIDAARTDVELAAVAVEEARSALEDATLLAPFDSLVALRTAERYATVSPGQTVVRIHDMSELRVSIEVPELLVRRVGRNPEITAVAELGGGLAPAPLAFRELTAEASEVGQTFRLSLAFTGPAPQRLLPGASVVVRLTVADPDAAPRIFVPAAAVRYAADGTPQLLVVSAEGRLSAVPVEIGPGPAGRFRMLSGPEVGTRIVAAGASRLADGDLVRRYDGLLDGGTGE